MSPTWAQHGAQKGLLFRGRSVPKITTIPEILHMGPRASKMGPRASKIIRNRASEIYKIPLQTACFFHSCFQHFLTTCLPKNVENMTAELKKAKKWHGGGLCAQRTGSAAAQSCLWANAGVMGAFCNKAVLQIVLQSYFSFNLLVNVLANCLPCLGSSAGSQ